MCRLWHHYYTIISLSLSITEIISPIFVPNGVLLQLLSTNYIQYPSWHLYLSSSCCINKKYTTLMLNTCSWCWLFIHIIISCIFQILSPQTICKTTSLQIASSSMFFLCLRAPPSAPPAPPAPLALSQAVCGMWFGFLPMNYRTRPPSVLCFPHSSALTSARLQEGRLPQ